MQIKQGAIIYFKNAKLVPSGGRKKEFTFNQGHGYGVFLGHVPEFMPGPPIEIVLSALGAIGYIRFDDIKEFMGEEVMKDLIAKWQKKYTEKIAALSQKAIESGKIKMVGTDGKPLQSKLEAVPTPPVEPSEPVKPEEPEYLANSEFDKERRAQLETPATE